MARSLTLALVSASCLLLAACSGGRVQHQASIPAPLPSAPSRPVEVTPLPPVEETVAEARPGVGRSASDVARESLLGGWQISSASSGSPCQLNMTLTGWTGGYRASTRGCASPELQNVNAWNLEDGQVVLKDGTGSPIARLAAASGTSMAGATNAGASVSANR